MSKDMTSASGHPWFRGCDAIIGRNGLRRRDWLTLVGAAGGTLVLPWTARLALASDRMARAGRRLIVLWTAGGASQIDTFDPKEAESISGGVRSIATNVPGITLAENLPRLAQVTDHLALIRSMSSKEGSHPRATHLMRTGYLPMAATNYPALGSHISEQLGDVARELPAYVRVAAGGVAGPSAGSDGGGFLGNTHAALAVGNPDQPPANARPAVGWDRFDRRLRLLDGLQEEFSLTAGDAVVTPHRETYQAAARMIRSPAMKAFDIASETAATQERYGRHTMGKACLLARRLIEAGVSCVEVTSGGWDTHDNNAERVKALAGPLDQGMATLVHDLSDRGLLDTTLVVCMGDFGRTPRINSRGGRDHYPRVYSVALAGGGVRGGTVVGASTRDGSAVADRPVSVPDLLHTIYHLVGVDPDREHPGPGGRPIKTLDGGTLVSELLG